MTDVSTIGFTMSYFMPPIAPIVNQIYQIITCNKAETAGVKLSGKKL